MPVKLITVAETPLFVRHAKAVRDEAEPEAFVDFIARNPVAGDVIPETGCAQGLLGRTRWASSPTT